ncbi:MAG: hypothetical protein LBB88_02805, partial [Planctomycetaceae bacterium]|nr:hypothetical protein [Planctomycetaceae bacterium]
MSDLIFCARTMLSKEFVTDLKFKKNGEIAKLVRNQRDVGGLIFVLENLGHLPIGFNADFL